ncbi:hepatic lectin-like [Rana temporaria]|uniref:hepatic lectin-like n=1 Tax=Rana temporaria TaxID=8407 RepID=UPI001AAC4F64|nr:hepatic lectin-like [Rana temporaria]
MASTGNPVLSSHTTRNTEDLEMESRNSDEEGAYATLHDRGPQRKKNSEKANAAMNTKIWRLLILVVLLIFLFLALGVVTGFLFISYVNMAEEQSRLRETVSSLTSKVMEIDSTINYISINASSMTSKVMEIDSTIHYIFVNGTAGLLCGKDWTFYKLNCYYKSTIKTSWNSAKEDCEKKMSHLVIINGDGEMNFLRTFSQKESPWVGLNKTEPNKWQWVDGTVFNTTEFWQNGQPDNKKGIEDCAQFREGDGLNDVDCSATKPYICEKELF